MCARNTAPRVGCTQGGTASVLRAYVLDAANTVVPAVVEAHDDFCESSDGHCPSIGLVPAALWYGTHASDETPFDFMYSNAYDV